MSDIHLSRWDWLLLSMAITTFGGLLRWLIRQLAADEERRPISVQKQTLLWRLLDQLLTSPWLLTPVQMVYAIGIPLLALVGQGALTARGLGLKGLSARDTAAFPGTMSMNPPSAWTDDIGWFVPISLVTFAVIALGNRGLRNRVPLPAEGRGVNNIAQTILEGIAFEVHWAFYREPFVVTWGIAAGCWLGVTPVLIELALNVMVWEHLHSRDASYARRMLVRGGLLVASTQLYLKTQNLWLAILMDCVIGSLTLRKRGDQSVTREAITTIL